MYIIYFRIYVLNQNIKSMATGFISNQRQLMSSFPRCQTPLHYVSHQQVDKSLKITLSWLLDSHVCSLYVCLHARMVEHCAVRISKLFKIIEHFESNVFDSLHNALWDQIFDWITQLTSSITKIGNKNKQKWHPTKLVHGMTFNYRIPMARKVIFFGISFFYPSRILIQKNHFHLYANYTDSIAKQNYFDEYVIKANPFFRIKLHCIFYRCKTKKEICSKIFRLLLLWLNCKTGNVSLN